jgi:hypothetical protein
VTLSVPGYTGAGSYTGIGRIAYAGIWERFSKTVRVPVTMTATGGDVSFARTLPGVIYPWLRGEHVTVDVNWSCMP